MTKSNYCEVIADGRLDLGGGHEFRVERIRITDKEEPEIRFRWRKNNRHMPAPMDATEGQLLNLLSEGIKAGVFTPDFRWRLKQLL